MNVDAAVISEDLSQVPYADCLRLLECQEVALIGGGEVLTNTV